MNFANRLHAALSPLIYGDGFALVLPSVNPNWPERQFLRRFLRRHEIDCVFDVGANVGQYATELRLIGYRGFIFSFEPSSAFAELERRAAADPKWHVFHCALGSTPGEMELNEMAVSTFNSLLAPSTDETGSLEGANAVVRRIPVKVDTLAQVLPDLQGGHGFRNVFLKMDTQGFDLEVFRGGAAVHDRIVCLQSEAAVKRIYAGAPRWIDAIAEYQAAGFELAGVHAVNPRENELVEFDCFFVRAAA